MNIPRKLFSMCTLFVTTIIACAQTAPGEAILATAINKAVAQNEEVIAWTEAIQSTLKEGEVGFGAKLRSPELRLKAEQDNEDDALKIGGALRWRLDRSKSKREQKTELDSFKGIHECKLALVEWAIRNELKKDALQLAYLGDRLALISEKISLLGSRLADQESLLQLKGIEVLSVLETKGDYLAAKSEKIAIEEEIQTVTLALLDKGFAADDISSLVTIRDWMIDRDELKALFESENTSTFVNLINSTPELKLTSIESSFEESSYRSNLREEKGIRLSYVQIQYEEENDQDKDDLKTSYGLSFGVKLPYWERRSRDDAMELSGVMADLVTERKKVESRITRSYNSWRMLNEQEQRTRMGKQELISDLVDLKATISENATQVEANQTFLVNRELLKRRGELLELDFELLEAAMKLEKQMYKEIVTAP